MRLPLFLLAASLAAPALAQNLTLKKPPPLLSRAELRLCMERDEALNRRAEALRKAHEFNQSALVEITDNAKRLAEELRRIDSTDAAAVDAYNERIKAHDALVDANNKRAEAHNIAVDSFNNDNADQMAACATRPYLQADRNAILAERRKNGQAPTPAPERPIGGRRPTSI